MQESLPPTVEPAILLPPAPPFAPSATLSSPTPPSPATADVEPVGLMPSPRQQSWGAFIALVTIVLMLVIGAFYAWGARIAQNQEYPGVTDRPQ